MTEIEVAVLNPSAVEEAERMAACAARLTQHGHEVKCLDDFMELYNKRPSENMLKNLASLPHPTLQKFAVINVVVVGASRRFLAQITRHQNEVKFMSASLQYSDYSGEADYVIPYELLDSPIQQAYLDKCQMSMDFYKRMVALGYDNDSAGYAAPQALRNTLIISATPYQWKHMIHQRTCRRNTPETRYVMLQIWRQLYELSPGLFSNCGPFCMNGKCEEGKMCCGNPMVKELNPSGLLYDDFPNLMKQEAHHEDKTD